MMRRLFGMVVALLLSVALFRNMLGTEPLSFYGLLLELERFDYDYTELFEVFEFFENDLVTEYDWWYYEGDDVAWYEYIYNIIHILGVIVQVIIDFLQVVVLGIWNLFKNVILTIFDFMTLVFRVLGFVS